MAGKPLRTRRNPQRIGLWSRRKFGALDKRLAEAKEEKRIIEALSQHVGTPTVPQQYLIRRTARSLVMVTLLEHRVLEGGGFGDLAMRQVIALSNSVRLNLQALGLARPEVQLPAAPLEYLAARRKSA